MLGGRAVASDPRVAFGVHCDLAEFAQNQLDWTLGRNPFDMCLLYGFGVRNPPSADQRGRHGQRRHLERHHRRAAER